MISKDDIPAYLDNPELVRNVSCEEIKKLIEVYPYCEMLHWIYLRALYINNDALFDDELMKHGMHISNRRVFYEYMVFTNKAESEQDINTETILNIAPSNYFDAQNNPKQQQSLKNLAEKLKQARLKKQEELNNNKTTNISLPKDASIPILNDHGVDDEKKNLHSDLVLDPSNLNNEEKAKYLIKNGHYLDALEILRSINLNNPKKSVYFALQIKFLETIINNNNKIN